MYRFFRDELHADWMQFIPIVERATAETLPIANLGWSERPGGQRLLYTQTGSLVTERSVGGEQYGRFLVDIYEEWIRGDVGKVFVQLFDVTLHAYFGEHLLCIHAPTCGYGPALEHNGDLYTCDHFVEPAFKLGNIHETHMIELVSSQQMRTFGDNKRDLLTKQCQACDVRPLCNGGCPKDRFIESRDGESGTTTCAKVCIISLPCAADHEHHGAAGAAPPVRRPRDGMGGGRRRKARPQRSLSLRQRAQVQAVPRPQSPVGQAAASAGRTASRVARTPRPGQGHA